MFTFSDVVFSYTIIRSRISTANEKFYKLFLERNVTIMSSIYLRAYCRILTRYGCFRYRILMKYFTLILMTGIIMLFFTQTELTERSIKENIASNNIQNTNENYWCRIPTIDPYNNDVKKYFDENFKVQTSCRLLQRQTYIENHQLVVKLKNVSDMRLCYIKRVDDFNIDVTSSCQYLYDADSKESCFVSKYNGKVLYIEDGNQSYIVVDHENKKCTPNEHFVENNGKYIHVPTKQCMEPKEMKVGGALVLRNNCGNDSIFSVNKEHTQMKHVGTGKCVFFKKDNGKLHLGECETVNEIPFLSITDLDVKVPLTDEFIKITYHQNGKLFEEFHWHVLPPPKEMTDEQRNENELDILMIMMDSLSNANAQRQLKTSYKYLNKDPNTVILKGHTINGDGTTAQLIGMLTGLAEDKTPEARRGMPGAKPVDDWPFMFPDLHKKKYVTLYSEDNPSVSTFQYRLEGFKKQPTHKYLRPFYQALSSGYEAVCDHKIALDYLQQFLTMYRKSKKFAFLNMGLSHNEMNAFRNFDDDLGNMFDFLKRHGHLKRTAIFVFGDHGIRAGGYRSTIVGKLEERLPFMSLTLPDWFIKKFPRKHENLRLNSELLTTHYDIHATLLHLSNIENPNITNNYERSLFSNVSMLKRTCEDANIESHWCPCVQYENVATNAPVITRIIDKTIEHINKLLETGIANTQCEKLSLSKVIRARKGSHSRSMQQFIHTIKNERCDSCALKLDENVAMKETYELTFSLQPSGGIFESSATIETINKNEKIDINPTVSRLNLYGNQPSCIAKKFPHLRKYCYCKGFKA